MEGVLKWTIAVIVALLAGGGSVCWAIDNFKSAPIADAVFALGVVTGTTAAAFDGWSRWYGGKGFRSAAGLGWWATVLTSVGLVIACYSATSSAIEPLPDRMIVEFFALMLLVSTAAAWCLAQLVNRSPQRPDRPPRLLVVDTGRPSDATDGRGEPQAS